MSEDKKKEHKYYIPAIGDDFFKRKIVIYGITIFAIAHYILLAVVIIKKG